PILSLTVQLHARAHRSNPGIIEEPRTMSRVFAPKAFRYEHFDDLTEQFLAGVTEQLLCLRVHERDFPVLTNDDDGIRCRFEEPSKLLLRLFPVRDVSNGTGNEHSVFGPEGAQADFDWKLGTVLPASV